MPRSIFSHTKQHFHKPNFGALYMGIVLLSFHWALVVYLNSTFLSQFVGEQVLNLVYVGGSIITILSFLIISNVLKRTGNVLLTIILAHLEIAALVGMAFAGSLWLAVLSFILHLVVVPLLYFNLDVFMEEMIGSAEQSTGSKRGLYLVIISLSSSAAPLVSGYLVGTDDPQYNLAYLVAAALLIPFIGVILYQFRSFNDPNYHQMSVIPTLSCLWHRPNLRNVVAVHFLLQLFFTWMVIYTPLYLATVIGLNWTEIGWILFIAMFAYVIFEYPIGYIADHYIGEKEMMALGFLILAISTSWIAFITTTALLPWMIAMFMTRVGASFAEATTESYFFKHTDGDDTNTIGLFRLTRPLSYVLGAALGGISLFYLPFNLLFVVLALVLCVAFFFIVGLEDTK